MSAAVPANPVTVPAPLLEVEGLSVRFETPAGTVQAVDALSFSLQPGEVLGLVGESGSGKSQTALALLGLLADNGRATGRARFEGTDLLALPPAQLNRLRGRRLSMVFQDPMTSLNPYLRIGDQMALVLRRHRGLAGREARAECRRMLDAVRIPEAARRLHMYPHELSGGMRQRVMIASALLCRPSLLIADEPTTALDVTVQAQILALLAELRESFDTAVLFITHDLGIVAGSCQRMLVMEKGRLVEQGGVDELYARPRTDYARRLLAAVPRIDEPGPPPASGGEPLLEVKDLDVRYPLPRPRPFAPVPEFRAVAEVGFELARGESLGVVGESGCGKSSLARAVLRLIEPAGGRVTLLGRDLLALEGAALRDARRDLQLVFQDPLAALDPRMTVRAIVAEPLGEFEPGLQGRALEERLVAMLRQVGLEAGHLDRYPHQFSGGQCQRIGIARALVAKPALLVCDEAVSALDVTVQARVIDLLLELQHSLGLALLFIAHDLAVVRRLCHRVMVMYAGRVMETGPADAVFREPQHPYTRTLLEAVPVPDPVVERNRQRTAVADGGGAVPGQGCPFRSRCAYAVERCAAGIPRLQRIGTSDVACHRAGAI